MLGWLHSLDMAIESFLNFDEILNRIVESIRDSSGFKTVLLSLLDHSSETLKVKSSAGIPEEIALQLKELEVPFSQIAVLMRKELKVGNSYFLSPQVLDKVQNKEQIVAVDIQALNKIWDPRSALLVPIDSRDGNFLGALFVGRPLDGKIPDMTKVKFLESFALSISKVVENVTLYDNARNAVKRLSTLYDVTTALGSIMKMDDLLREVVAIVRKKLGYRTVGILLLDETGEYLKVRAGVGYSFDLRSVNVRVDSEGVTGLAVKEEKPILVKDVRMEPRYIGERKPKSEIAIPLITKAGVTGVLDVESEGAGSLTDEDMRLLTSLAMFIAIAIENARLYERTQIMAITDELTGAFNYRHLKTQLNKEIDKAKKKRQKLSLLMFDLDNFKEINDSKGHTEGDRVLRDLAEKLKAGLRKDDIFTRYGGDEFMVVLPGTDKQEAITIAHRLKRTVEENRLKTSIGVSTYPDDSEHLIEAVDKALYKAKEKGGDLVYSL